MYTFFYSLRQLCPLFFYFIFWFILVSRVGGFPTGLAMLFKGEALKIWLEALPACTGETCPLGGFSVIIHQVGLFLEGPHKSAPGRLSLELSFLRVPIDPPTWGLSLARGLRGGGNGRAGFLSHTSLRGSDNSENFPLALPSLLRVAEGQGRHARALCTDV